MRNIIISGGGLINKGAQAMTLISVCELKKRYPGHRILLLSWNTSTDEKKRHAMYDLELLQIPPMKFTAAAKNPLKKVLFSLRYGKPFAQIDEIYRNTELLIDVSGYALGSNWSEKVCNDYLDNIEFALAYDIPVVLMPQSFGPFDYAGEAGKAIDERTRRLFPRVKHIFAREQEGYDALVAGYGLSNVTLTRDMVLTSTICDYSSALREKMDMVLPEVSVNSVCIIPSFKIENTTNHTIQVIYCPIIEACLSLGLNVYISHHSSLDFDLCADLKAAFADNDRVTLLEQDRSCIEFNELVKKFRFIVSSRFHAIVHALKNGVPCIALGWAVKYIDLLNLFGQGDYMIDLRGEADPAAIHAAIAAMNSNFAAESQKIKNSLPALQQENVFDRIKEG